MVNVEALFELTAPGLPRPLPRGLQRLFIDSNRLVRLAATDFPAEGSELTTLSAMGNEIEALEADALRSLALLRSVAQSLTHGLKADRLFVLQNYAVL